MHAGHACMAHKSDVWRKLLVFQEVLHNWLKSSKGTGLSVLVCFCQWLHQRLDAFESTGIRLELIIKCSFEYLPDHSLSNLSLHTNECLITTQTPGPVFHVFWSNLKRSIRGWTFSIPKFHMKKSWRDDSAAKGSSYSCKWLESNSYHPCPMAHNHM